MFIIFEEKFTIEVRLSTDIHRYLKMRYFGFIDEKFSGIATHCISFGEKLTDKPHEIIRPPVAKGKKTFLFDKTGNTLYSNFRIAKFRNRNFYITSLTQPFYVISMNIYIIYI